MIKKSLKGMVLVLAFSAFNLVAQQTALTENDVIKNADALFTKKDYQAALPLYAQLVACIQMTRSSITGLAFVRFLETVRTRKSPLSI